MVGAARGAVACSSYRMITWTNYFDGRANLSPTPLSLPLTADRSLIKFIKVTKAVNTQCPKHNTPIMMAVTVMTTSVIRKTTVSQRPRAGMYVSLITADDTANTTTHAPASSRTASKTAEVRRPLPTRTMGTIHATTHATVEVVVVGVVQVR